MRCSTVTDARWTRWMSAIILNVFIKIQFVNVNGEAWEQRHRSFKEIVGQARNDFG